MKGQVNEGLAKYQEEKRQETLQKIDKAIEYLKGAGLKITKRSVAEEAEISYYTLQKDYVKAHLLKYAEFNPDAEPQVVLSMRLDALTSELEVAKYNLKRAREINKQLKAEIVLLKENNRTLEEKYRRILGTFQTGNSKKIITF